MTKQFWGFDVHYLQIHETDGSSLGDPIFEEEVRISCYFEQPGKPFERVRALQTPLYLVGRSKIKFPFNENKRYSMLYSQRGAAGDGKAKLLTLFFPCIVFEREDDRWSQENESERYKIIYQDSPFDFEFLREFRDERITIEQAWTMQKRSVT